MARPNKKGPIRTIDVRCARCNSPLFIYRKGGKGALVKCFRERISKDFTADGCTCPNCNVVFARETLIRGTPAYKIIGRKVVWK